MSQSKQKALFREGSAPPGGTCLSSFVILTTGSDMLVGKMMKPEVWVEKFFVGPQWAQTYYQSKKYMLPASHLAWYESPLEAAARTVKEQTLLPLRKDDLKLIEVQSHLSGDPTSTTEPPHWDICFVYEGKVSKSVATKLKQPEWFEDFGFVSRAKLKSDDFTRGHGDVLEKASAIGKPKKKKGKKR